MKQSLHFIVAILLPAVLFPVIMLTVFCACSGEDEIIREGNAETSVVGVTTTDGQGDGSSASPALVTPGKPCTLTIAQRSTYTEPDGTLFSCEPKAVIHVETTTDTIYAGSAGELTQITADEQSTDESGNNPKTSTIQQCISLGGKKINFRLTYEQFSHTNKAGNTFTMPYLELQPAKIGRPETAQSRTDSDIPAVTLRHLSLSRGPIVSDTAQYEVTARFSVEALGRNSVSSDAQAYNVEVRYAAVVVSDKELPDPFGEVSYTIKGAEKPYTLTADKPLTLTIEQQSSYTDSYSQVCSRELSATLSATLGAEGDSLVFAPDEKIELTKQKVTSQLLDRTETTYSQRYTIGKQTINFSAAYQKAFTDESIEMPYMKIDTVKFNKIVSATEISNDAQNEKKYQIKALFDVDVESENAKTSKKETVQIYVTYVMRVVVKEPQIVKVVYRPGYEWFEPRYNLTLSYIFIVYRDCYYDNGKVETSRFNNYVPYTEAFIINMLASITEERLAELNIRYCNYPAPDGSPWSETVTTKYSSSSTGVEDASLVSVEKSSQPESYDFEYIKNHFEEEYDSKDQFTNYDESVNCHAPDEAFVQNFPKTTLPTGWYLDSWGGESKQKKYYYNGENCIYSMGCASVTLLALVIDGRIVMFEEWFPKSSSTETTLSYTGNFPKGTNVRIEKRYVELQFLGRNFYGEHTDTIYQFR